MGFDWTGAVTFAHGAWMGPPRVLCGAAAIFIGMTIAGILCAILLFAASYLPKRMQSFGMFASGIISIATQIWGISLSMAIYEYWRGLEPTDPAQRRAERGEQSSVEKVDAATRLASM
jgi:hypothetical protein